MDSPDNILNSSTHSSSVKLLINLLKTQGVHIKFNLLQTETMSRSNSLFKYQITDNRFVAYGQGNSKKKAKQSAAMSFLCILNKKFPELCPDSLLESHINYITEINTMFGNITLEDYDDEYNSIDKLHQLCKSHKDSLPVYKTERTVGLPHNRIYTMSCNLFEYKETGESSNKRIAKRIAAHKMFLKLNQIQIDKNKNKKITTQQNLANQNSLRNVNSDYFNKLSDIHKTLPLTEGTWFNYIKGMENEQLYSCDSEKVLDSFIAEQGLKLTFIDFEELSHSGTYQTSLHIFTSITLAFCGDSTSYKEAHKIAAIRALEFFKSILSNRAYKPLKIK